MTRLQAAIKDSNWQKYKEKQQMKREPFTKCKNCGERQLYTMYNPQDHGFTTWCLDCGSKDQQIVN